MQNSHEFLKMKEQDCKKLVSGLSDSRVLLLYCLQGTL